MTRMSGSQGHAHDTQKRQRCHVGHDEPQRCTGRADALQRTGERKSESQQHDANGEDPPPTLHDPDHVPILAPMR
jgi:hypothetical protein